MQSELYFIQIVRDMLALDRQLSLSYRRWMRLRDPPLAPPD